MLQMEQSFARLRKCGAIADEVEHDSGPRKMDAKVTFFGRLASHMPCDLVQSRILMVCVINFYTFRLDMHVGSWSNLSVSLHP
jgi:hypothetical protein